VAGVQANTTMKESAAMADINGNTPESALAYCDYLIDKGYATTTQINPWKTAIQRVFETVEGEGWEALDLTAVDLEEYGGRFQTLAGAQYKAESVTTYRRRVNNALQAHEHYRATGRPPSFRKGGKRAKPDEEKTPANVVSMESKATNAGTTAPSVGSAPGGLMTFPFPLGDGRVVSLTVPPRMKSDDVNRLAAFLRTLQDDTQQRQIPPRTGDDRQAA
jgi:hypothetical protein